MNLQLTTRSEVSLKFVCAAHEYVPCTIMSSRVRWLLCGLHSHCLEQVPNMYSIPIFTRARKTFFYCIPTECLYRPSRLDTKVHETINTKHEPLILSSQISCTGTEGYALGTGRRHRTMVKEITRSFKVCNLFAIAAIADDLVFLFTTMSTLAG